MTRFQLLSFIAPALFLAIGIHIQYRKLGKWLIVIGLLWLVAPWLKFIAIGLNTDEPGLLLGLTLAKAFTVFVLYQLIKFCMTATSSISKHLRQMRDRMALLLPFRSKRDHAKNSHQTYTEPPGHSDLEKGATEKI